MATNTSSDWIAKLEIIPDLIDSTSNLVPLKVSFPSGEVKDGNIFKPAETKNQPNVHWDADTQDLYTLINVDPDAPSRKESKYRSWRHWVVVNIPGNDISQGHVVSNYMGAGPPAKSGLHRYVFLLYKQNGPIQVEKFNDMGMNRASFLVREFANNHDLGQPVAVVAYQAQTESNH